MAKKTTLKRVKKTEKIESPVMHLQIAKQMVTLATNGFGLVAALAWNNVIQDFVNSYIKKWLPGGGGILSLLVYAVLITILAVLVTTHMARTVELLEKRGKKV